MRIVSGRLGGRVFNSSKGHRTHPMSEKMRGAIFNILGDISGLSILDAFGGSGAISFEAASRGAENILVIESDRVAQKTIDENIKLLGLQKSIKPVKAKAGSWLKTNPNKKFDIVILDPPFDDLDIPLITDLSQRVMFNGVLVLSWPSNQNIPDFSHFRTVVDKNYGDSILVFLKQVL